MAVPKQRHTKSRRNNRRSHISLDAPALTVCQKCKKPVLSHRACLNCGYYKKNEIIDVLKKLNKKEKKKKEKKIKTKEKKAPEEAKKEKPMTWEGMSKK